MKSFLQIAANFSRALNAMEGSKLSLLQQIRQTAFTGMHWCKVWLLPPPALTLCAPSCTQGGFDIAERMFYSVKKEWESSSRDNMGDVRELIPEFFYLPDFLLNSNHIQLGQTHILPPLCISASGWRFGFPATVIGMWGPLVLLCGELIHMCGYINTM